jgi:uncharacterized membrane protein YhaH (DUF805 family)
MTFNDAVRSVFGKYAVFSGRARRSEYWYFYLFTLLVSAATSLADSLLRRGVGGGAGVLSALASLVLLLPSLAVTVRRLHDTGRRGWWILLPLAPALPLLAGMVGLVVAALFGGSIGGALALVVVGGALTVAGAVMLLVFLCLDSDPGANRYGPSPQPPPVPGGGWGSPPALASSGLDEHGHGPSR